MGKAQLTIEFFFILTLFTIVLYQLSSFQNIMILSEATGVINQQKTLANDLTQLANNVCNLDVDTTIPLPCIITSQGSKNYLMQNGGPNKEKVLVIAVIGELGEVTETKEAFCAFQIKTIDGVIKTAIELAPEDCNQNNYAGKTICMKKSLEPNTVDVTENACP